jgi:hypothetical protein
MGENSRMIRAYLQADIALGDDVHLFRGLGTVPASGVQVEDVDGLRDSLDERIAAQAGISGALAVRDPNPALDDAEHDHNLAARGTDDDAESVTPHLDGGNLF